jgi:hypothetical protein
MGQGPTSPEMGKKYYKGGVPAPTPQSTGSDYSGPNGDLRRVTSRTPYVQPEDKYVGDYIAQNYVPGGGGSPSTEELLASLLGGGGGSSGGGRGGGGGGGASSGVAALQKYLADYEGQHGAMISPYETQQSGLNSTYAQALARINQSVGDLKGSLAQGRSQQDTYNQMLQSAYGQQGNVVDNSGYLRDLAASGIDQGALQATLASRAADNVQDQGRRSQLANALVAARNSAMTDRDISAASVGTGALGGLEQSNMAYNADLAKQRAAAEAAYQQQLAQIRLQIAQAGG